LNKQEVIRKIIGEPASPSKPSGHGRAPANIALVKYWGKRNDELNLPVTSNLSISLGDLGTDTSVETAELDEFLLNGRPIPADTAFAQRLRDYLDLFRPRPDTGFKVITHNTIPTAAGLASSASGYAALAIALDDLFGWQLDRRDLSILARLGSGSASRSVYDGFAEWHAGKQDDGMDSFAEPLDATWPDLRIGLVKISVAEKSVSSRKAMKQTVETATLYRAWPEQVATDLVKVKVAIASRDFERLGATAENNALAMHATSIATWPPTLFWLPESVKAMHKVWELRGEGLPLYFTMDAGPNLKLLTTSAHVDAVNHAIHEIEWVIPFL
jgi:diphosphomevalonate decarboxylase